MGDPAGTRSNWVAAGLDVRTGVVPRGPVEYEQVRTPLCDSFAGVPRDLGRGVRHVPSRSLGSPRGGFARAPSIALGRPAYGEQVTSSLLPVLYSDRGLCCSLLFWALLSALSAAYASSLYAKYTPLYTPITCSHMDLQLRHLSPGIRQMSGAGNMSMVCRNPNRYDLTVRGASPGSLFVGPPTARRQTGTCELRELFFPSGATSVVMADFNMDVGIGMGIHEANQMLLFESSEDVSVSMVVEIVVSERLGLSVVSLAHALAMVCGAACKAGGPHKIRFGHGDCSESFDALRIPPYGETSSASFPLELPRDKIAAATRTKDLVLRSAMVIGYGLAIVLLVAALCVASRLQKYAAVRGEDDGCFHHSRGSMSTASMDASRSSVMLSP